MGTSRESSEVEILKPRTDKREYKRVVLPNSLEVLLISDPETDKAAASMNVSVGNFSDPKGLEGLAHFLEHMLFYASAKYPREHSYMKYIAEHGGRTNAFTAGEHTNFHFDVNSDCFEEALDRFAQFFIKPLMPADATLREIKAVDSENRKNLLSDSWRMSQLQKYLSSEDHPYHKFGTGNLDTLQSVPKANGKDTRQELNKFHEDNYSASLMHLVVYGKETLAEIQNLVEKTFKDVPNTGRCFHSFQGQPCASEHLQILVKTVPVKQGHKLRLIWPVTPCIRNFKAGSSMYIGHLIKQKGEGSLHYILKTLGWAINLSAWEGNSSYEFSFLSISIELTDVGHEHVEEIVGLVFKYIFLIKDSGVEKWIFDELVSMCEMRFHYQDKFSPIKYVPIVAENMQLYPPKDWIAASSLPSTFSPSAIHNLLDELTPNSLRIFWESKKFEGCTNLAEPWYKTAYSIEKFSISDIQRWMDTAPNASLRLPTPNEFIPTNFSIKYSPKMAEFPVLLRENAYSRLWFKPDTTFLTPKAYVRIHFSCPLSNYSPEASAITHVYTRLLMDYLNEYTYNAQVAGLYFGICDSETGFQINLSGYNHKMGILLETIIAKIASFEVKPDRFSVVKESVSKEYENIKFQQPSEQALYYCSLILKENSWPWSEELEAIYHLEANDLAKFSTQLLSKTFLECYVGGNLEPKEAEHLVEHIENILFLGPHTICKPLFPSQHLAIRVVKLEKGLNYCYPTEVLNSCDENSALVYYIQVHQDNIKMNAKLQLFAFIAKQPAFNQLRTVEQLGYITVLKQRDDAGIQGLQFIIQSTLKDPSQLDTRVVAFLEMFESKLHDMTSEDYKSNVNALINMKLEKYKNLWEESSFYWGEIIRGTFKFDRREAEVEALKELTQKELIDFFNDHVKVDAPRRKTLSVQVYGGLHTSSYKLAKSGLFESQAIHIDDIFSFRKSRPLYGSFRGPHQTKPCL